MFFIAEILAVLPATSAFYMAVLNRVSTDFGAGIDRDEVRI